MWLSPIGFLGRFARKSLGTLGFPRKRRKRHAETTKPSEKSGTDRGLEAWGSAGCSRFAAGSCWAKKVRLIGCDSVDWEKKRPCDGVTAV